MPTDVKTYDPAAIALNVGGYLVTGFETGTFITLSRNVTNFDLKISVDGAIGERVKHNDKSALLTITLSQTSPANAVLSRLAARDEDDSSGIVPVSISDTLAPDTEFATGKAWVEKPADAVFADDTQGRQWLIKFAEVVMFHGGTPTTEALTETLA